MKYAYLGKEYHIEGFRESFSETAEKGLQKWLEAIIFTEQPYLADNLHVDNADEETQVLLRLCNFFSAVLRDEKPKVFRDWSLEFENKHHSLVGFYLNFIQNIYFPQRNHSGW